MAVDAGGSLENAAPGRNRRLACRERFLLFQPTGKFLRSLNINSQQHPRMLRPAVLGALTQEKTRSLRFDPHRVDFVWDQLRLSCESRHPETVHDVRRAQVQ